MNHEDFDDLVADLQQYVDAKDLEDFSEYSLSLSKNPFHLGVLPESKTVFTSSMKSSCDDDITWYLDISEGRITQAFYDLQGCATSGIAASQTAKMIDGILVQDARQINAQDVLLALGKFPKANHHCAVWAVKSMNLALDLYEEAQRQKTTLNLEGPRIYNLFPRLFGQISKWKDHLIPIKEMGFNWIYINPLNDVGFSGSLYSIKDYFTMNPIFAQSVEDQKTWKSFQTFIEQCHEKDIKVMIDLVINHTAVDMVQEHPTWYKMKWVVKKKQSDAIVMFYDKDEKPSSKKYPEDEFRIVWDVANAYAVNPDNTTELQIWGDLAEIDFNSPDYSEIESYFCRFLDFNLKMGVDGFRCDAAYQVPTPIWRKFISYVKNNYPNAVFWAETLGATMDQYLEVEKAGMDFITTSVKWWDFTAPWCLEQYNAFRKFAPSVSFPENHDTPRFAWETGGRKDIQIFRYLFSAFFSAGVMITSGYEFGFQKKTDVVNTTPEDWGPKKFDISQDIALINEFKKQWGCLNEDGPIKQFEYNNQGILLLQKSSMMEDQKMFLIYNKDWEISNPIYIPDLKYYLDFNTPIYQLTILGAKMLVTEPCLNRSLKPNEYLLYVQNKY
ncbi:alpha-amylase family glycosyl hydrolase [Candidatus Lokiarchaeum ossiferum]|uniref:alpha-amylase family glycosyl hydrolase n=1 Tax=Candidatus Lokiarchaeum ossiferum TaxID=2951803 RepID=UPI00352D5351